jgi:prephenate dehydrogenase
MMVGMQITVIGLGLIGGSALLALERAGNHLTGYDADPTTRQLAETTGARVAADLATAAQGAELVVLAVPLPALAEVLDQLAAAGYAGLVTDVTSVKQPVAQLVAQRLTGVTGARFVGGHPMAGKETSGFAAADPDLFQDATWVLCPVESDATDRTQRPAPRPGMLYDRRPGHPGRSQGGSGDGAGA